MEHGETDVGPREWVKGMGYRGQGKRRWKRREGMRGTGRRGAG